MARSLSSYEVIESACTNLSRCTTKLWLDSLTDSQLAMVRERARLIYDAVNGEWRWRGCPGGAGGGGDR